MKDEQKIAQAKRMEELIVYLKTTARELARLTGVHENTLYKICCAHNTISNRTAARICFNIEKTLGIVINRQWLLIGEGPMLDEKLSTPPPYKSDGDEQPSPMAAEDRAGYGYPDYREKYFQLTEEYLVLQKKYTALLEGKK